MEKQNIWFTSDNHIGHKNILKHCKERAEAGNFDINDIEAHDKWLIDIWNNTVKKHDIVYIDGDFFMCDKDYAIKMLGKMNGDKHLILGNHDKTCGNLHNYFVSISQRKEVIFKKEIFDFLKEDFDVTIEHFAMLTWNRKHYGACQVMGHSHGRLDDFNTTSCDLRLDVGWDGQLANYNLVSLEQLYNAFKAKANNKPFLAYTREMIEKNMCI